MGIVVSGSSASSAGIGVEVDGVDVDEATVLEHGEAVVEQAAMHQDRFAGMASGNLVVDGIHGDGVLRSGGTLDVKHEATPKILVARRHSQGALVGAETLVRG